MIKLATITPIDCIAKEQDGEAFAVLWDADEKNIVAQFEGGRTEIFEERAKSLENAIDIVYALYAPSIAFVYEPEEVDI